MNRSATPSPIRSHHTTRRATRAFSPTLDALIYAILLAHVTDRNLPSLDLDNAGIPHTRLVLHRGQHARPLGQHHKDHPRLLAP